MQKEKEELNIKDFKKSFQQISKNRYKFAPNGYKLDRWIFTTFMLLIFGWLFYVGQAHNWQLNYFECNDPNSVFIGKGCENPFYKPVTWENSEWLPPGKYGTKPGALFNSIYYVPLILLGVAGLLNHFFHNKKKVKA